MERSAEGNAVYTINDMNMPDDLKWLLIPKKNSSISVVFLVVILVMAVCMAAPTGGVCRSLFACSNFHTIKKNHN